MYYLLLHPLWPFVGVLTGILTVSITCYFAWSQHVKKSLSYDVIINTSMHSNIDRQATRLRQDSNWELSTGAHMVTVQIANDGTTPITRDQFERPVKFEFGPNVIICGQSIVKTYPDNLQPDVSVINNQVLLSPLLLNPYDYLQISVLVSRPSENLDIDARIEGISKLTPFTGMPPSNIQKAIKSILLALLLVLLPLCITVPNIWWMIALIAFCLLIRVNKVIFPTPSEVNVQIEQLLKLNQMNKCSVKHLIQAKEDHI